LKKRIIICMLSAAIVLYCVIYIINVSRTQDLLAYLESKGYSDSEIKNVTVEFSFASLSLGYPAWTGYVEFEDEIGVLYSYGFVDGISQGHFLGDSEVYGNLEKEKLLEKLKHLER